MRKLLFIYIILILLSAGCGKRQTVVYDQPEVLGHGYYETAWVDPEIIYSDTLYTIIRASRVDSFYVERPENPLKELVPSLVFHVDGDECFTWINLLDDQNNIIKPLLARNLSRGYYKITCEAERINIQLSASGIYFIKADFCGYAVKQQFTRR